MVQVFDLGAPACGFILSEANGHRSRENGVVASGQGKLAAGTVVMDNGSGKLIAYGGGDTTEGGTNEAAGIICYAVDATSVDVAVAYIARDAEVNQKNLVFPANNTANPDNVGNMVASLGYKNIIVRD